MTEHVHDHDVDIDVLCSCGEPDAQMNWSEFLTGFAETEVLPERRRPLVLRVRFTGQRGRSKGAKIDAGLRKVLGQLVQRGAVKRTGNEFVMPGIVSRSCGNGH